jgi:hypothetical protein
MAGDDTPSSSQEAEEGQLACATPARLDTASILGALGTVRSRLYMTLDVARSPSLFTSLRDEIDEYHSLFDGAQARDLWMVAPYLMRCRDNGTLAKLVDRAWGNHSLLFILSATPFRALRMHLREHLRVRDPDGNLLLFRYYDPRVLRGFLSLCTPEQRGQLFDTAIDQIWVESADATQLESFARDGTRWTIAGM